MGDQSKKDKLSRMAMQMGIPLEQVREENYADAELFPSLLRSNIKDPQITIRPDGIQFNNSCIRLFEDVVYIYIGIIRDRKWLMINECERDDIDSQRWCNEKKDKLESRKISCRDYTDRIYKMMNWNKGYYYKIVGQITVQEGDETKEPYMLFELSNYVQIPLTEKGRAAARVTDEEVGEEELAKIKAEEEAEAKAKVEAEARGEKYKRKNRYTIGGIDVDSLGMPRSQHTKKHVIGKDQEAESMRQMTLGDLFGTGG